MIVGGIAYPRVIVTSISMWRWQVLQRASVFAGDDERRRRRHRLSVVMSNGGDEQE